MQLLNRHSAILCTLSFCSDDDDDDDDDDENASDVGAPAATLMKINDISHTNSQLLGLMNTVQLRN